MGYETFSMLFHLKTSICHCGNKMGESKTIVVFSCGGVLLSESNRPASRFLHTQMTDIAFQLLFTTSVPKPETSIIKITENQLKKKTTQKVWFSLHIDQDSLFYATVYLFQVFDIAVNIKFSWIYMRVCHFIFCCQELLIDQHFVTLYFQTYRNYCFSSNAILH